MMEQWRRLFHLFVSVLLFTLPIYMVIPTIADVTVEAMCDGKDECSLAIYLTGFQQAIAGLGSVVTMPLLGRLSDTCGRKSLLTIPMTLAIFPLVILAYKRTMPFVFAYYVFKSLTAMVSDGGVLCLSLGYLADSVSEEKRVQVFSVLYGVTFIANVFGTLAAGVLSVAHIFQVGALVSIVALVYMRIFLRDTTSIASEQPLLESTDEQVDCRPSKDTGFPKIPSPKDVLILLNTSNTFVLAACITFFGSLAENGAQNFLTYFLKARFGFNKNQFSIVFLIVNVGAALSNMFIMPISAPFFGESALLSFALFTGFINMLLNSIAWSPWVPYASSSLGLFFNIWPSSLRSIVSKQVGFNEQGIAQGCIMGITSLACVMSPIIFSPLSALFLSENAPFKFPGFCILCIGLSYLMSCFLSIMILIIPHFSSKRVSKPDRVEG